MTTSADTARAQVENMAGSSVFSRVIAGADGSEPGFEAVRQAARLVAADGWLEVFTAVHLVEATLAGLSAPRMAAELEREAGEAIRKAKEIAGTDAESHLVNGPPLQSLMHELQKKHATLAVVGTHGHSRLSEIMIGGVAGELLHNAPCSVLVARPPMAESSFPRTIVVGNDGSPQAEAAVDAAQYLARRFNRRLRVVTAVETVDQHPVGALVDASRNADILVVGSRGLHGLRALGSASERVAHQAVCSVLVVRSNVL